ncbi:hypothetical protein RFI_22574, partial [Reticulomyxa filosa]
MNNQPSTQRMINTTTTTPATTSAASKFNSTNLAIQFLQDQKSSYLISNKKETVKIQTNQQSTSTIWSEKKLGETSYSGKNLATNENEDKSVTRRQGLEEGWYYVNKTGNATGPVGMSELKKMYVSGELKGNHYLWNSNKAPKWVPLNTISDVFDQLKSWKRVVTNQQSHISMESSSSMTIARPPQQSSETLKAKEPHLSNEESIKESKMSLLSGE